MEDKEYYRELQANLRSYDIKLWAIPGLFFTVLGLIIGNIEPVEYFRNAMILFFGILFLIILLLNFYKTHFFHVSIQKKINKFDSNFNEKQEKVELKRMPLESMSGEQLRDRIRELELEYDKNKNDGFEFSRIQKFLIKRKISNLIKSAMWIAIILLAVALVLNILTVVGLQH